MSDESTFLTAIHARPDDGGVRLAYADWLESHGDLRARFLRIFHELPMHAEKSDAHRALVVEKEKLRLLVDRDWQIQLGLLRSRDREAYVDDSEVHSCHCRKAWNILCPTECEDVRYCAGCEMLVHFCEANEKRLHDEVKHYVALPPLREGELECLS